MHVKLEVYACDLTESEAASKINYLTDYIKAVCSQLMLLSSICRRQTPLLSVTWSVPVVAGQGYMHAITLSSSFLNLCSPPHPPLPTNPHIHQPCKVIPITAVLWRTSLGLQRCSLLPSAFFLCQSHTHCLTLLWHSVSTNAAWLAGKQPDKRRSSCQNVSCVPQIGVLFNFSCWVRRHFPILVTTHLLFQYFTKQMVLYGTDPLLNRISLPSFLWAVGLKLGSHKHFIRWKKGENGLVLSKTWSKPPQI